MISVHVITLCVAPFFFTGTAFSFSFAAAALFAYSMGIFHHMFFTHNSFECKPIVRNLGALFGTLTWRGPMAPPIRYVAIHRVHHAYADRDGDPHSPVHGHFHAFMSWFWNTPYGLDKIDQYQVYAPELMKFPFYVWLDKNTNLVQFLWGVVCFGLGCALEGTAVGGLRYVIYGVFVKTFFVIYLANAVDVVNHTIGYRNYETKDQSTNSFIMAVIHLGGAISWHNNHHAHQEYFSVRSKWWELDAHYIFLKTLSLFGLTWNIKYINDSKLALDAKNESL